MDAEVMQRMHQIMQNPGLMEHMMSDPDMLQFFNAPAGQPTHKASFEDPELTTMLSPIRKHKQNGTDAFKKKDAAGALAAYQAAVTAAGSTNGGPLAWPQVEELIFACRSNAALCLLQLGRPDEAIAECDAALAMACANGSVLLPKVLARKLEALVDAARPRATILGFVEELRRRGTFDIDAVGQAKIIEQLARLSEGTSDSATSRAFDILTAQWAETKLFDAAKLDAATDRVARAPEASRDRAILRELSTLAQAFAPTRKPLCSVHDVIRMFYSSFSDADHEPNAEVEATSCFLRVALSGQMHPCFPGSVDPVGDGYLLWGLVTAFERSLHTSTDVRMFLALLKILVDEFGADVNQRGKEGSRLPLMYVARSGCLPAVRAMIARGASLHLRDEEGWTPLLCCCMNDVPQTDAAERVACLQALLDASADVNAKTIMGGSAMFCAASHDIPHFELMGALLRVGADASIRGKAGDSVTSYLTRALEKPAFALIRTKLEDMLERIKVAPGRQAQLEAQAIKFGGFMDTVLVPAYNEGVVSEAVAERKEQMRGVMERMAKGGLTEADKAGFREKYEQERRVLSALMRSLGMDAGLLSRRTLASDGNWLAELHRFVHGLIPSPFLKVYCEREPTDDEVALFFMLADGEDRDAAKVETGTVRTWDQKKLRRLVTTRHRDRGTVSKLMVTRAGQMIFGPIQHTIGYAVPNDEALNVLEAHGPLVEVGAGTGYWSAVLQQRGVDVVAFDSEPPSDDMSNSFFYDFTFTDIAKGDGTTLFVKRPELAARALVLIWPNNPDPVDHPHLVAEDDKWHSLWDTECLESYMAAGGHTVIYVGERESQIALTDGAQRDSGITGSRRFQDMLRKHFTLAQEVSIPRWFHSFDDLTVWIRAQPEIK